MESNISLEVRSFRKNEADSTPPGSSDDRDDSNNTGTVSEEEKENGQVEENKDEDNKGFISIQLSKSSICIFKMYLFLSLDVMLYLSKELDGKSLVEKITHIRTEWTRKEDFFKKTRNSKGSCAFNFILWILR